MSSRICIAVFSSVLSLLPPLVQSAPVDVDGDGKVGPQEVFDLLRSWSGQALPLGGVQPWQTNGTSIFYNSGNVGIGTNNPTSRLEIAAQDGLAITGFQPFLTLRDTNSGGARGLISSGNGDLGFYTNGTIGGNPLVYLVNSSGAVGIGTTSPNASSRLNVLTGAVGHAAIRGDAPNGNGVVGTSAAGGYGATSGIHSGAEGIGVYGEAATGFTARGVWGKTDQGTGVYGTSNSAQGADSAGVLGRNTANNGTGVIGEANNGASAYGVWGRSTQGRGVYGEGPVGVSGFSSSPSGVGVNGRGENGALAGAFYGRVEVYGELVEYKSISRMDHPLDSANKYLTHASVGSSEIKNFYDGTVVTDGQGYSTIVLPDWFEALNRDFRYQLTVIGQFAQAIVSEEIHENRFDIKTDKPNVRVSWQVTGIRNDAYAKAHPIEIETMKSDEERGKYLMPELFGQPKEKGIGYRPEMPQMAGSE